MPTFLGVECSGPDVQRAASLRDKADGNDLLAKFFELSQEQQLGVAAVVSEMVRMMGVRDDGGGSDG